MNIFQRILYAAFFNSIDSAQYSSSRSWRSTPLQDARLDVTKATREKLQGKSRDWELSSALYQSLATTWEQYTVGTGIQLPSASSNPEWNKYADEEFELAKPLLNLETRFGFDNDQGIISRRDFIEGEMFILLTNEGPYARYQLIEGHLCRTPDALAAQEGKTVVDGVKIDPATLRPVGYYFFTGDQFRLVDAPDVVHVIEPGRARQYRGIPRCTASLNTLHDLQDLRSMEMLAAKDAATRSTVIKTASGEMPQSLANMAQRFRNTSTASGTTSSVADQRREYYKQAIGGETIVLQHGDDVSQHVPARPGAETREYWRLLANDVCADAKIPLSLIWPDTMQGTVFRGSLDCFASFCRGVTSVYATHFTRVRNYAIRRAAVYNPKLRDLPADWQKVSPGTVRAPNVDIGRNSAAVIAELRAGLRTWSSVAAELGLNGQQILRQKATEVAFIKSLATEGVTARDISDAIEEEIAPAAELTTPSETTDPIAQAKIEMDAYGVGVRAGAITPNTEDENFFRQKLNLPSASSDVMKAWEKDEGTRRPITLTPPPGEEPATPFTAQSGAPTEEQTE